MPRLPPDGDAAMLHSSAGCGELACRSNARLDISGSWSRLLIWIKYLCLRALELWCFVPGRGYRAGQRGCG